MKAKSTPSSQLSMASITTQFMGANIRGLCQSPATPTTLKNFQQTRRRKILLVQATSSARANNSLSFCEGERERPHWTGDTPASRFVATLTTIPPLYNLMKFGARQVLISTAEKNGIAWREMAREILASEVYKEKEDIENPSVIYPDYYLKPFHAYKQGNLSWEAAAEVEAATMSMCRRAIPSAASLEEATQIVRGNWLQAIEDHHIQNSGGLAITDILDVGCSVGVSTRFLADKFPCADVMGLDLSPYFLAVAEYKEKLRPSREKPIKWIHANGEETGLPSALFDIISLAFVIHECPQCAIRGLLKEAYRLLRPGGTVALTDNSPKSKIIQNLSPVLFTLMKSTEPHLDEYFLLNLEDAMQEIGFVNVQSILTDPRHRTVTASVPTL
ncbi:hypothetical protein KI387_006113 [Taxus chinensis]|uniref:Methyltransferase type 11 domain-containing protein n=1 Tax=Taxus chinensis TaxID=29808 RepID=A0AA38GSJ1_TAXCH|nr:hypothetical protein KI387_006113 [Taxus chinensis]